MNAQHVASVATAVSREVASALSSDDAVMVLGGDCTVELGTVAGVLDGTESVGLVYVDLDTDSEYAGEYDTPLAENTRRNVGLTRAQLMAALRSLLQAPNWVTLTVCELSPDHGESDGSNVRTFAEELADAVALAPRWRRGLRQLPVGLVPLPAIRRVARRARRA